MTTKRAGGHNRGRTRYQPLIDYLAACTETEIILSVAAIEAILGASLPEAAYAVAYFWTGETNLHVRRWRSLGWRGRYDRRHRCVVFTRAVEE